MPHIIKALAFGRLGASWDLYFKIGEKFGLAYIRYDRRARTREAALRTKSTYQKPLALILPGLVLWGALLVCV